MKGKVIKLNTETEEKRRNLANKISVIEELERDKIISQKEAFKIRKKLVT